MRELCHLHRAHAPRMCGHAIDAREAWEARRSLPVADRAAWLLEWETGEAVYRYQIRRTMPPWRLQRGRQVTWQVSAGHVGHAGAQA